MTADDIREHCRITLIERARLQHKSGRLAIVAEGVRDTLRWMGQTVETSDVISALSDSAFESLCAVKLLEVKQLSQPAITYISVRF